MSDLREAISKISEVGQLLAPLTSSTFDELSTSSHEYLQVNRPTVNREVSDPQSIAPSRFVNHELQSLFPTLRRSNEQASPSGVTKTQTPDPETQTILFYFLFYFFILTHKR